MASITQSPTVALPNKPVKATITLTGSGSNYARLWLTAAPTGSDEALEFLRTGESRKLIYAGAGGAGEAYEFTPKKSGVYVFAVQEYTRGSDYGGGYQDDPNADPTLTLVSTESTVYVRVANRLTQTFGQGSDTSKLVCYVQNATIVSTSVAVHGEKTPRLEGFTSTSANTAELSAASAVASLADVAAATALGVFSTIITNIMVQFDSHRTIGTIHNGSFGDDTINLTNAALGSPTTERSCINAVNDLLIKFRRHITNDEGDKDGPGGAAYHTTNNSDYNNLPRFQSVGSFEQVCAAVADLWACYEAHRVNTSVHSSADSTNTLTTLPSLLLAHKAYMTAIRSASPTAQSVQNAGVVTLVHGAGFKEG